MQQECLLRTRPTLSPVAHLSSINPIPFHLGTLFGISEEKGDSMWNKLELIKKNLSLAVLLSLVSGLIAGALFDLTFLKPFILPVTILMVYPMMVPMQLEKLVKSCNLKLMLTTQLINFVVLPLIALFLSSVLFPAGSPFHVALLFVAILPTSGMTISWTGLAKGDVPSAVKITLVALIGGALLLPLYANYMDSAASISVVAMVWRVVLIIGLPLIAGQVTRLLIVQKIGDDRFQKRVKGKFPLISTLAVVLMIFIAVGLKAKTVLAEPMLIVETLLPLLLFYTLAYVISALVGFALFSREQAISMIFGTAMRNLSVALAIAVTSLKGDAAQGVLLISLAFIIQIQSASLFVKLLNRKEVSSTATV